MSDRRETLPPEDAGADDPVDDLPDYLDDNEPEIDDADNGGEQDDAVEDDLGEAEPEPERRRSRGGETIRALRSRAQEAERRAVEAEARARVFEGRQQMPDPLAAAQAAEAEERRFVESLVGLMPEEIAVKVTQRSEQRMRAELAQIEVRGFDRSDKAQYDQLRGRDRFAEAKANEVETMLGAMRNQGIYQFGRLDILDFLRGRESRLRAEKTGQQERRNGQRRLAQQTTRPASGRGDGERASTRRRSDADNDIALLRGTTVGDVI